MKQPDPLPTIENSENPILLAPDAAYQSLSSTDRGAGDRCPRSSRSRHHSRRKSELGDGAVRHDPAQGVLLGEPDVAVGTDRNVDGRTRLTWNRELGHLPVGRDSPDPVAIDFPAIHAPVSNRNHRFPSAPVVMSPGPLFGTGQCELRDLTARCHAADLAGIELGEPHVPVRTRRDRARAAVRRRYRELRDHSLRRDAADAIARELPEPQVAVRGERDGARLAVGRRNWKLGDLAAGSDPADAIAQMLGEPDVVIRAEGDDPRRAAGIRQLEFLEPVPSGAIRPIRLPAPSVNQSVPSGAMAMVVGPLLGFGKGNSVNLPSGSS